MKIAGITETCLRICCLGIAVIFMNTQAWSQCTNCGMGTSSPTSKLHVKGCTMDSTTSSFRATDSANTAILYVQNNKRIGINTTNPRTSLHIQTSGNGGLFLNNTSGNPLLGFYLNSINTATFMMGVDASDSKFKIGTTSLTTNTRLTIDGSGNGVRSACRTQRLFPGTTRTPSSLAECLFGGGARRGEANVRYAP